MTCHSFVPTARSWNAKGKISKTFIYVPLGRPYSLLRDVTVLTAYHIELALGISLPLIPRSFCFLPSFRNCINSDSAPSSPALAHTQHNSYPRSPSMSLPTTTEPCAAPNVQVQAAAPPTASSWSRQLKERLERLDKATSAPVDLYPGTPAYNAARKLEKTIEATWRAYLVELVRNDLAAGVVGGRRKHYWEKNECLIVYELVEGSRLEEFPSSDVGKREEYLACTVRDALYIKVPQFSSSFTFPWPSPTVSAASPCLLSLLCHCRPVSQLRLRWH